MFKKCALGSLVLLFVVSPVFASAQNIADLQAQIQALLVQIISLKAQIGGAANVPAGSACASLVNNLSVDDTDADTNGEVTKLQQFLANLGPSIYPEARVTGYFGPATMRAIQRWQKLKGIVSAGDPDSTGYGFVGARTRAAMLAQCGVSSTQESLQGLSMKVNPYNASNNTFEAQFNLGQWTAYTYEIDWGEGDTSQQTTRSRVNIVCNSQWTCTAPPGVLHMYSQPGYYEIRLFALKTSGAGITTRALVATASARAGDGEAVQTTQRGTLLVSVFDAWTTTGRTATFSNVAKDKASQLCAIASNDATCVWNGQVITPTPYLIGSFRVSFFPTGNPLQSGLQHHVDVADTQQGAQYHLFAIHKDLLGRVDGIHELETREEVSTKSGVRVFAWYLQQRVTNASGLVSIEDLPEGTYQLQVSDAVGGRLSLVSERLRVKTASQSRSSSAEYAANTPLINGHWDGRGIYFDGGPAEDTLKLIGRMAAYDIFRGTDFQGRNETNTVVFVQNGSAVIIAYNAEYIVFDDVKLTVSELLQRLISSGGAIYRSEKFDR